MFRYYQSEFAEPLASHFRDHTLTLYLNLPATFVMVAPLAILPFPTAFAIWSVLTAAAVLLSAALIWDLSPCQSRTLSGALIGLSLVNSAIVLGNGNPAGLVVALTLISIWCFYKQRCVLAGVFCLAVSLALKPHDAGFVWLYLLLAGGTLRKRALQSLGVTVLLTLAGIFWVSQVSSGWLPELRSNMATMATAGANNDPGPRGPTARLRSPEMIVDLQSAISVFRDEPQIYNTVAWLVCGAVLSLWIFITVYRGYSTDNSWLALAAVAPVTLLVTYHRGYDARLILLAIPACANLYAEKGNIGRLAIGVTGLAFILTGEVSSAVLNSVTKGLPIFVGLAGKIEILFLGHPAPLALFLMMIFYLWIYSLRVSGRPLLSEPPADKNI
ncbi:MAG: DUF2029 domain-containing protein [Acidobacteria bacterium]|nr:DUF2029 domain-containing protein [Acidobacteriota bacterium]